MVKVPKKITQTTYYGEEDTKFLGDSSWIELLVEYERGKPDIFSFQGSWDGRDGPAECRGIILGMVTLCEAIEVHRLQVNEAG